MHTAQAIWQGTFRDLSRWREASDDPLLQAGNQPRLRLKEGGQPGVLEFEMFDITNLKDASTPHVQRIVYKIIDGRKMTLEILWKKGQSGESEKYTLSRI